MKLSKFLYGKSKVKISCPLFLYFIRNEEEDYRKENIKFENSIEIKINLKSNEDNNKESEQQMPLINNILSSRKWLKFNRFSCRYYTFFLIYAFVIKP